MTTPPGRSQAGFDSRPGRMDNTTHPAIIKARADVSLIVWQAIATATGLFAAGILVLAVFLHAQKVI